MLKKYILALFLFFVVVIGSQYVNFNTSYNVGSVRQVYNSSLEKSKFAVKEIMEENEKISIRAYFPETKYPKCNEIIQNYINSEIKFFKNESEHFDGENEKCTFDVTFDSYEYGKYISIVLNITYFTGGAHPNEIIKSVCFDTKNNLEVTIDDLVKNNNHILGKLSSITYDVLKNEERIKEYGNEEMLKDGTKPLNASFSNFAFSKNGMIIFFNRYQVAPYVAGTFKVNISYEQLEFNI